MKGSFSGAKNRFEVLLVTMLLIMTSVRRIKAVEVVGGFGLVGYNPERLAYEKRIKVSQPTRYAQLFVVFAI